MPERFVLYAAHIANQARGFSSHPTVKPFQCHTMVLVWVCQLFVANAKIDRRMENSNKAIKFGAIPFNTLKIAYFRVFDKDAEPHPFFDATDEQILKYLAKVYHENVVIIRIEDVRVLEVVTYVPEKRKLDVSELKAGISHEERQKRDAKIDQIKKTVGDNDKNNI